jgi:Fe-S-cluster-containing hydrogenase component 2
MKESFYRPLITVTFKEGVNNVGVLQHACVNCGDCVTGCNYGAKNTVLMNYLPDAKNHGAEIFTEISLHYLERQEDQWRLHFVSTVRESQRCLASLVKGCRTRRKLSAEPTLKIRFGISGQIKK